MSGVFIFIFVVVWLRQLSEGYRVEFARERFDDQDEVEHECHDTNLANGSFSGPPLPGIYTLRIATYWGSKSSELTR